MAVMRAAGCGVRRLFPAARVLLSLCVTFSCRLWTGAAAKARAKAKAHARRRMVPGGKGGGGREAVLQALGGCRIVAYSLEVDEKGTCAPSAARPGLQVLCRSPRACSPRCPPRTRMRLQLLHRDCTHWGRPESGCRCWRPPPQCCPCCMAGGPSVPLQLCRRAQAKLCVTGGHGQVRTPEARGGSPKTVAQHGCSSCRAAWRRPSSRLALRLLLLLLLSRHGRHGAPRRGAQPRRHVLLRLLRHGGAGKREARRLVASGTRRQARCGSSTPFEKSGAYHHGCPPAGTGR